MSKLTQQEIDAIRWKVDAIRSVMTFEVVRSDAKIFNCMDLAFRMAEEVMREHTEKFIAKNSGE